MARDIRKTGCAVYPVMWAFSALITVGAARLLVRPGNRTEKYLLTLGALLLAQALIFVFSAATVGRFKSPAGKVLMETGALLGLYQAAVLVLALAAGVMPVPFSWLLAAHAACLLALCVTGAVNLVALWRIRRGKG